MADEFSRRPSRCFSFQTLRKITFLFMIIFSIAAGFTPVYYLYISTAMQFTVRLQSFVSARHRTIVSSMFDQGIEFVQTVPPILRLQQTTHRSHHQRLLLSEFEILSLCGLFSSSGKGGKSASNTIHALFIAYKDGQLAGCARRSGSGDGSSLVAVTQHNNRATAPARRRSGCSNGREQRVPIRRRW